MTERLEAALADPDRDDVATDDLLSEGYAHALRLDAERLALERRITALAAAAHEEKAAQELRRAWLKHRTLAAELRSVRALLRQLRQLPAR